MALNSMAAALFVLWLYMSHRCGVVSQCSSALLGGGKGVGSGGYLPHGFCPSCSTSVVGVSGSVSNGVHLMCGCARSARPKRNGTAMSVVPRPSSCFAMFPAAALLSAGWAPYE